MSMVIYDLGKNVTNVYDGVYHTPGDGPVRLPTDYHLVWYISGV